MGSDLRIQALLLNIKHVGALFVFIRSVSAHVRGAGGVAACTYQPWLFLVGWVLGLGVCDGQDPTRNLMYCFLFLTIHFFQQILTITK